MSNIDDIIINLKVISSLQSNQKIITKDKYLNVEVINIIPQSLKRWWRGDNRDECLKKIDIVINESLEIYKTNSTILEQYLKSSATGLTKLKETYSMCVQTCSRIDTIIDKINRHLGNNELFSSCDSIDNN